MNLNNDINFLLRLKKFCQRQEFRLVISGGYGLDANLGSISRPHHDIDAIIYGQLSRKRAGLLLPKFINQLFPHPTISIHENDFMLAIDINSPGFGANLYFVETAHDPQQDINTLILKNGKQHKNNKQLFLPPVTGNLLGHKFEAQNPNFHLADILSKQSINKQAKHDIDITNLRKITSPKLVNKLLLLLTT